MFYLQNKAKIMPKNLQDTELFKTLHLEKCDLANYKKLGFATQNASIILDYKRNGYVYIDEYGHLYPMTKVALRELFFARFYKNNDFFEKKYSKNGKQTKEKINPNKACELDIKDFFSNEISVGSFIFDPKKPRISFKNNIVEINDFFKTEIAKKALEERKKRIDNISGNLFEDQKGFQGLHQDLKFLEKYHYTKVFLENLFCYQCDTQKEIDERLLWVLAWMSKSFVNYDKRRTAIVIHGAEGTGKDTFVNLFFKRYFSEKFCSVVSNEELKSNFTSQKLASCLLCQMNEIKGDFRDGNTVFDKIKTLITEREFKYELKGQNALYLPCYFNVIICSNDTKPIQVSDTARRYSVFYSGKSLLSLAQENGFDTAQFLENLEKEADDFLVDLVCFNYDVVNPDICLNTREVGILKEATNSKMTIFTNNLKNGNIGKIKEETIENAKELWHKPEGKPNLLRFFKDNIGVTEKIKDFVNLDPDAFENNPKYLTFDFFVAEVIEAFFERFNKIKSVQGVALSADLRTLYQINIGLAKNANEVSIKLKEHLHLEPKTFKRLKDLEEYKNKYFEIPEAYKAFKIWEEEIQF
ncbi:MAG: DUF5906 domain-containing protein [Campylobacter sp.]|nr:DUF5906 domain-containing protein [Campylobacter sp.]